MELLHFLLFRLHKTLFPAWDIDPYRAYRTCWAYRTYTAYRTYRSYRACRARRAYGTYSSCRAYIDYKACRIYKAYRAYRSYRTYIEPIEPVGPILPIQPKSLNSDPPASVCRDCVPHPSPPFIAQHMVSRPECERERTFYRNVVAWRPKHCG